MSKEYTFSEAIEIMKSGDIFSPYNSNYGEFKLLKGGHIVEFPGEKSIPLTKGILSIVGQIIPAKKVMVSSIEVVEACLKSNGQKRYSNAFEVSLVTEAEKNRDLLYSKLMNEIKDSGIRGRIKKEFDKIEGILFWTQSTGKTSENTEQGKRFMLNMSKVGMLISLPDGYHRSLEGRFTGVKFSNSDCGTITLMYGIPESCFDEIKGE